jgi:hypothetical protein
MSICVVIFVGIADDSERQGVIPNAFEHIMNHIGGSQATKRYLVRCSYLEIYQEQVRYL